MRLLCLAGLALPLAPAATGAAQSEAASPRFYRGVTEEQSERAHNALRAFYNGHLKKSDRLLLALDSLEDAENLPPLSRLLAVATTGLVLQRNDAEGREDEARLRAHGDSAAAKGLRRCQAPHPPDQASTYLLIEGGIRGFQAVLQIDRKQPVQILPEGLRAVRLLEKALAADTAMQDANLGLGIFECTAAGKLPRVLRPLLGNLGRKINLETGLAALRMSGYSGQYTTVASQLYLIQFLSPYDDELRREKTEIFRSLQETFPLSPYYTFLAEEEALCFYPDSFYNARTRAPLERRMRAVETRDYAAHRYLNLIKYQYTLLNPHPSGLFAPDTAFALREYAFYPAFIEALRARRNLAEEGAKAPDRKALLKDLKRYREIALTRLRKSGMSPANVRLYEWHIRDALRPEMLGTAP